MTSPEDVTCPSSSGAELGRAPESDALRGAGQGEALVTLEPHSARGRPGSGCDDATSALATTQAAQDAALATDLPIISNNAGARERSVVAHVDVVSDAQAVLSGKSAGPMAEEDEVARLHARIAELQEKLDADRRKEVAQNETASAAGEVLLSGKGKAAEATRATWRVPSQSSEEAVDLGMADNDDESDARALPTSKRTTLSAAFTGAPVMREILRPPHAGEPEVMCVCVCVCVYVISMCKYVFLMCYIHVYIYVCIM